MEKTLEQKVKEIPYWYHRIELPSGDVTPGWSPIDASKYSIPDDLTGKRVLDIGAWDGYWTWEALKRGAKEVVAIDDFSDNLGSLSKEQRLHWETFDLCREAFGFIIEDENGWINKDGQKIQRHEGSVYDITEISIGRFDVVFFFGTIYHLKHPLLALEKISAVCDGALYVETATLDEYSPYRGGVGKGFDNNEMVMEFYPGKEYGCNESNWWTPTLQCLGAMMASVGFKDIEAWPLTETPKELAECRGFASGTKNSVNNPANHPPGIAPTVSVSPLNVCAVMSVPRLGFQDNMECAFSALMPLKIPLINVQGAFWGQCLERGMQMLIDNNADVVITIDYDTVFTKSDIIELVRLMREHPEATAIVPIQCGRGNRKILTSMKTKTGQMRANVPLSELKAETTKISTGHFGLTAIRTKHLLDIPHPWLWGQPNGDNQWGPGRVDDDIYFWRQLEKNGKTVLLANRIVVGHLELLVSWPDENLAPIFQMPGEFHDKGRPKEVWK
jgi:tRNA (mo5U34)-methyltransferase